LGAGFVLAREASSGHRAVDRHQEASPRPLSEYRNQKLQAGGMSLIGTAVNRWANETAIVSRYTGYYDSGRFEKQLDSSFSVDVNIQPAAAADLERLPENYRRQGSFWIYPKTSVELRTGSAPVGNEPGVVADEVEINGIAYEVGAVDRWRQHQRYLVARAQQ
jgi:hypothetical protein